MLPAVCLQATCTRVTAPANCMQAGTRLALSESDRRALVIGLALHEKGKQSLKAGDLQVLLLWLSLDCLLQLTDVHA